MDKYTRKILAHIESYNIYNAAKIFTNEYNLRSIDINNYIENNMLDDYNYEISRILKLVKGTESNFLGFVFLFIGIFIIFFFDYNSALLLNIIGWVSILISIYIFISVKKEKEYNRSLDQIILNPSKFVNLDKDTSAHKIKPNSLEENLLELKKLLENELITKEEYESKRKQIIDKY